jgi:hypothetical protein
MIIKKDELLTQISKFNVANTITRPNLVPTHIKFDTPSSSRERKSIGGGIEKKRHVVTIPSNVSFNALKRELLDTPVNITQLHKR